MSSRHTSDTCRNVCRVLIDAFLTIFHADSCFSQNCTDNPPHIDISHESWRAWSKRTSMSTRHISGHQVIAETFVSLPVLVRWYFVVCKFVNTWCGVVIWSGPMPTRLRPYLHSYIQPTVPQSMPSTLCLNYMLSSMPQHLPLPMPPPIPPHTSIHAFIATHVACHTSTHAYTYV